jgi:carbohydrate diacid regulator
VEIDTELQHCQHHLSTHHPDTLTAAISPREMVVLESFDSSGSGAPSAASARQRLLALASVLRKELETASVISLGVALTGVEGIALSYQCARKTMRVGRLRNLHETTFSCYDLSLPVLLSGLGSGWQAEQLRQPVQRLDAFDKRSRVLRRTLEVWFAQNAHPVATASALHIQRNTLDTTGDHRHEP